MIGIDDDVSIFMMDHYSPGKTSSATQHNYLFVESGEETESSELRDVVPGTEADKMRLFSLADLLLDEDNLSTGIFEETIPFVAVGDEATESYAFTDMLPLDYDLPEELSTLIPDIVSDSLVSTHNYNIITI